MRRLVGILLVAVLAVGVAVWQPWSASEEPAAPPAVDLIPTAERRTAPEFTVETTAGDTFRLAEADEPVVVTFLTMGCASCEYMVGQLGEAYERLDGAGTILLLDLTLGATELEAYYRGELGGAPHLYAKDERAETAKAFEVRALGETYVLDPEGRIAFEGIDPAADQLVGAVEQARREA